MRLNLSVQDLGPRRSKIIDIPHIKSLQLETLFRLDLWLIRKEHLDRLRRFELLLSMKNLLLEKILLFERRHSRRARNRAKFLRNFETREVKVDLNFSVRLLLKLRVHSLVEFL